MKQLILVFFILCFSIILSAQEEKKYGNFKCQLGIGATIPGNGLLDLNGYEGIAVRNELQYEISKWFSMGISFSVFTEGKTDKNSLVYYSASDYSPVTNLAINERGHTNFLNLSSLGYYLYINPVNTRYFKAYFGTGICYNILNRLHVSRSYNIENQLLLLSTSQQGYRSIDFGFQMGCDYRLTKKLSLGLRINAYLDDVGSALMLNFGYRFVK